MGEFFIYYRGKIIGGIYDNRFLIKPTKSSISFMHEIINDCPYYGAKEMLLVDNIDSKEYLERLLNVVYDELPSPKKK